MGNIKVLDHTNECKIDYFNDIFFKMNENKVVPHRVYVWSKKCHGLSHMGYNSPQQAEFYNTTKVKDLPEEYRLIEYGKLK